jgi:hypothetical protein
VPAAQCILSFLIWIAFGVLWRRRVARSDFRHAGLSRGTVAFRGAGMLVYGAVWLLGGLFVVQAFGGLTPTGLKPWAWTLVTVAGIEFVRAQMVAVAKMVDLVSDKDTHRKFESSNMQESEESEP